VHKGDGLQVVLGTYLQSDEIIILWLQNITSFSIVLCFFISLFALGGGVAQVLQIDITFFTGLCPSSDLI
jgi:hypothetical protein